MNDEEKKAWEEFVESANVDLRYRATCTRLGQSIPERVAFSLDVNTVECILAADAELQRLRATAARVEDVEGMANLKPNASGRHSMATKRKNEAAEKGFEAAAEQLGNAPGMSKKAYVQDGSTRVHVPNVSPLKIESK